MPIEKLVAGRWQDAKKEVEGLVSEGWTMVVDTLRLESCHLVGQAPSFGTAYGDVILAIILVRDGGED